MGIRFIKWALAVGCGVGLGLLSRQWYEYRSFPSSSYVDGGIDRLVNEQGWEPWTAGSMVLWRRPRLRLP